MAWPPHCSQLPLRVLCIHSPPAVTGPSAFHFIALNGLLFFPGKTPKPCLCPMRLDSQALPMSPASLPPHCPLLSAAATSASTQVLELTVPLLPWGPSHLLNLPPCPHDPLPNSNTFTCSQPAHSLVLSSSHFPEDKAGPVTQPRLHHTFPFIEPDTLHSFE